MVTWFVIYVFCVCVVFSCLLISCFDFVWVGGFYVLRGYDSCLRVGVLICRVFVLVFRVFDCVL